MSANESEAVTAPWRPPQGGSASVPVSVHEHAFVFSASGILGAGGVRLCAKCGLTYTLECRQIGNLAMKVWVRVHEDEEIPPCSGTTITLPSLRPTPTEVVLV